MYQVLVKTHDFSENLELNTIYYSNFPEFHFFYSYSEKKKTFWMEKYQQMQRLWIKFWQTRTRSCIFIRLIFRLACLFLKAW